MNCDEARELIQLYMDNELDARTTLTVRDHLESCGGCSGLLEAFERQDSLLREEAKRETFSPEALGRSIIETIGRQSARPSRRWLRRVWLRAAAIVILLVPLAVYLLRPEIFSPGATVCALAASDHASHCSLDVRWKGVTDEQQLWSLARSYGLAGGVPDLSTFGFAQPCGWICKLHDSKYLHIVYYTPGEESLSLFTRNSDSASGKLNLTLREQRGYHVVIASGSGCEVLVVSTRDEKSTSDIARAVWQNIAANRTTKFPDQTSSSLARTRNSN